MTINQAPTPFRSPGARNTVRYTSRMTDESSLALARKVMRQEFARSECSHIRECRKIADLLAKHGIAADVGKPLAEKILASFVGAVRQPSGSEIT